MSSRVLQVEGQAELQASLAAAAHELNDFSGAAKKTAALLGSRGRVDAPRLTGRLSASVRGNAEGNDAAAESALDYAGFVHWGTSRQRAQPWLVEGRDDSEQTWLHYYADRVDEVLRSVKGA